MRWNGACLLMAFALSGHAQEFEVVSIKPNNSLSGNSGVHTDQGMLRATNVSLRNLIVRAYNVRNFQVEGPDWLASEHFDVAAKFPVALPKDRDKYNTALGAMMQNMLRDRFKLRTHSDQKIFSVYAVTVARSGIKVQQVPDCDSHNQSSNNTHYTGTCVSLDAFAEFLTGQQDLPADLPVLNMTGLTGFFDLKLDWLPETDQSTSPTLLHALEEQLGLKLESRKAPIEILIVDHAERRPSDN